MITLSGFKRIIMLSNGKVSIIPINIEHLSTKKMSNWSCIKRCLIYQPESRREENTPLMCKTD